MAVVEVADEAGACYGVERALGIVERLSREAKTPVHTLGPLIHNPLVVERLAASGVDVVSEPEEASCGDTLVLRTHGVTPWVESRARESGLEVVDATCPFVTKVHRLAERLDAQGYSVVIVGEEGHPEVEGTRGHVPGAPVVLTAENVRSLPRGGRVAVVVQTTLELAALKEVVSELLGRCDELRVYNTICDATSKRQRAAVELASRADVMLVVGGKNSANTNHLAHLCEERARTYHVESEDEISPEWFEGASLVGITAGASTPKGQVEATRSLVERLCG